MKKNILITAIATCTLILAGCGMGAGQSSNSSLLGGTTTTGTAAGAGAGLLGSVLGAGNGTTGSVLTSAGTTVVGTLLNKLLGNTTNVNTIAGTWTYSGPKVAFESEKILAQIGSSVVSSKIESTLGSQLEKMGFKKGKSTIVFTNDGQCQVVLSNRTLTGTYTYNQSTGQMTIQGAFGVATVTPYVSVVGNEMYMLFEADKLLSVMGAVANIAKTSVISNLLGSYNGLKLGWTMQRK